MQLWLSLPSNSGSHYFDYKDHHSIMLLAVFGPNYECLWADIGTNGRAPDGAICQRSDLKEMLASKENKLHLPPMRQLPMRSKAVPFVLTGDDAFGLTTYLMKPYPAQISHWSKEFLIIGFPECEECLRMVLGSWQIGGECFGHQYSLHLIL